MTIEWPWRRRAPRMRAVRLPSPYDRLLLPVYLPSLLMAVNRGAHDPAAAARGRARRSAALAALIGGAVRYSVARRAGRHSVAPSATSRAARRLEPAAPGFATLAATSSMGARRRGIGARLGPRASMLGRQSYLRDAAPRTSSAARSRLRRGRSARCAARSVLGGVAAGAPATECFSRAQRALSSRAIGAFARDVARQELDGDESAGTLRVLASCGAARAPPGRARSCRSCATRQL
jgi:hypothetical protein